MNTLYYGDNLTILREHIKDESVDLIYLDPPFNSNRNYNVLFKDESGHESEAQITAFEDTWHWTQDAAHVYHDLVTNVNGKVGVMIGALHEAIGENQMMAYLVMMAARLVELHRVLKPTGSLYLHCDPTASHYLKMVLDTIFGPQAFINEIVWKRTTAHNTTSRKLGDITDTIFFYGKTNQYIFNPPTQEHNEKYIEDFYRFTETDGRRYRLDKIERNAALGIRPNLIYEYKGHTPKYGWMMIKNKLEEFDRQNKLVWNSKGRPLRKIYLDEVKAPKAANLWDDITPIQASAAERLGYPTQKPLALLERIVSASSNVDDVVLDPFCGCGTTVAAAQKLGRQWLGIDITHLAIALQKYRLKAAFNLDEKKDYQVIGEPEDLGSAQQLAHDDRYQFQWWALSLVKARPLGGEVGRGGSRTRPAGKKGSDKGIDGLITFIDDSTGKPKRIIVQVKSGKVKSGDLRDLRGTLEREGAVMALFITLETPTKDMAAETNAAGFYHSPAWGQDYPKLQILTIDALLAGATVQMPPSAMTFKQAQRESDMGQKKQKELFD